MFDGKLKNIRTSGKTEITRKELKRKRKEIVKIRQKEKSQTKHKRVTSEREFSEYGNPKNRIQH